jgi:hypothetical protein
MDQTAAAEASPKTATSTNSEQRIVFVAGSGRSGTSLMVNLLEQFGFHVPQPEILADATNPRGFGESQWVVDFHNRLLRSARVLPSDARPYAWFETGKFTHRPRASNELQEWLAEQLKAHDDLIVKDPRLIWFLPMWQQSAIELGARSSVITMLRHPAEVVASKESAYGGKGGVTSRTTGWLNLMLYTERATRDTGRVFVRYSELLEDWTTVVAAVGDRLDQPLIQRASAQTIRAAHRAVDPSLRRSSPDWDRLEIPARVRLLAEQVWVALEQLADDPYDPGAQRRMDSARSQYGQLYEEAERIVTSSIWAAGPPRRDLPDEPAPATVIQRGIDRLAHTIPHRVRERLPAGLRARVRRAKGRPAGG